MTRKNNTTNEFSRKDYLLSLVTLVFLPYAYEKFKKVKDTLLLKIDLAEESKDVRKYKTILYIQDNIKILVEAAKLVQYLSKNLKIIL